LYKEPVSRLQNILPPDLGTAQPQALEAESGRCPFVLINAYQYQSSAAAPGKTQTKLANSQSVHEYGGLTERLNPRSIVARGNGCGVCQIRRGHPRPMLLKSVAGVSLDLRMILSTTCKSPFSKPKRVPANPQRPPTTHGLPRIASQAKFGHLGSVAGSPSALLSTGTLFTLRPMIKKLLKPKRGSISAQEYVSDNKVSIASPAV
jgi:hypothetical protein